MDSIAGKISATELVELALDAVQGLRRRADRSDHRVRNLILIGAGGLAGLTAASAGISSLRHRGKQTGDGGERA